MLAQHEFSGLRIRNHMDDMFPRVSKLLRYIYIHIYTSTHADTHVHVCIYMHVSICTYTYTYAHIFTYI